MTNITKKRIRKIKRKLIYFIAYLTIIPLSYLMPKKDYIVLATRFGDFEGNLKYFYIYLTGIDKLGMQPTFLTHKKEVFQLLKRNDLEVWYYPSLVTKLKLLRAKVLIVDGNEWSKGLKYYLLFNTKKVQIWHGTGLKTIGLLKPAIKKLSKFKVIYKKEYVFYDLLTMTSEFQASVRAHAFRYGRLMINGFPRNDIFYNNGFLHSKLVDNDIILKKYKQFKSKGLYLVTYTPTWRRFNKNINHLSLKTLDRFAQQNKLIFVIKLHPKQKGELNLEDYKYLLEYDKKEDIYPLLVLTDLLITDYSSIYLDFLLVDRPIVFYPYDRKEYVDNERHLLLDYDNFTPGPKCYSQSELEGEIARHLIDGVDDYKQKRDEIRSKLFQYMDGQSSCRLWNAIKGII
jgi:CDP-glycerol glycerophosphotransferase (TagB/SpsB family)